MEHRRVCFRMLSLLPLVQISKLSQANSLLFGKVCCRTPRGVRGLKFLGLRRIVFSCSRTPRGVRGLKYTARAAVYALTKSHPSRGAWIEIVPQVTAPSGGWSHPSRGAWIEIIMCKKYDEDEAVAPLAGCVD